MWTIDIPFRWLYPIQPTMYEIGAFFLSHKMVVRRMKKQETRC